MYFFTLYIEPLIACNAESESTRIIDKQFDHMIFVCKQLITAGHMRPLYGHVPCYSLMLIYNKF
jgi:hypothetical protein